MGVKLTKDRILARLQTERDQLRATLAQIPDAELTAPHFEGGWSVKDLLAHITFWDRRPLGRIQATLRAEPPPPFPLGNCDQTVRPGLPRQPDRPLADVLADFDATFQALMTGLAALSEDDLADPQRFPWTGGRPLKWYLRVDGYAHYTEHTRQIRAWLATRPPDPAA